MARTLPWSTDQAPSTKRQRTIRSAGPHPEPPFSSPTRGRAGETLDTPPGNILPNATPSKQENDGTPASSPAKAPPSSELMHEGYDGDDIYIMVEDEFNTVAQSYTAHLHLAEYKRLVRQAREAPPKALPEPTSPMSKQAKQRLKADALQHRQKEALQKVLSRSAPDDEEEDTVDDPWSGTSLAPLMAGSNQRKTSLLGLEKISSNTKAGMGFARPTSSGSSGRDQESDDLSTKRNALGKPPTTWDYDMSTRLPSPTSGTAIENSSQYTVATTAKQRNARANVHPISHAPASVEVTTAEPAFSHSGTRRPRTMLRQHKDRLRTRQLEDEKKKKSRLEEVPMFII
ncbi:hypothetical protein PV08_01987 [Exophiala spinifera]|uniref:Uncharacterized protein n=1 Tax=Exophiala spinifera TaxID=91928 RepID=A0A0D2A9G3_9EURO|nr:uncharacterized protein PV08_01987 [Exophiala spinifera]KIW21407.1 hypothetical protein PV08_01987 [Exophiala spinifera]